jgi:hypothetical protein
MLNFESKKTQNSDFLPQSSVLEVNSLTHSPNNLISNNSKLITENSKLEISNSLTYSLINSRGLIEFPLSTVKLFGQNVPISGGGYFRLFHYSLIRKGLKSINQKENKPFIFYLHPWELDFEQPKIKEVRLRSRFRHYVNLNKTESKFRKLLEDFQFSTIREILIQNS